MDANTDRSQTDVSDHPSIECSSPKSEGIRAGTATFDRQMLEMPGALAIRQSSSRSINERGFGFVTLLDGSGDALLRRKVLARSRIGGVNTGQFKICKLSPDPTLQGVTFPFTDSYSVNGTTVTATAAIMPGQCSGLSGDIPVVDASGNPIPINVSETSNPAVKVSKITLDGSGALVGSDPNQGTAVINIGQGVTMVTYTNLRTPASIRVVKSEPSPGQGATVTGDREQYKY